MALEKFTLKQGDTRPKLVSTLLDNVEEINGKITGEKVNLSDAMKVQFIMREVGKTDDDGPKVKDDCVIIDDEKGIVSYTWKPEDTDTVGEFQGEFEVTWSDGGVETIPNAKYFEISIVDDLG